MAQVRATVECCCTVGFSSRLSMPRKLQAALLHATEVQAGLPRSCRCADLLLLLAPLLRAAVVTSCRVMGLLARPRRRLPSPSAVRVLHHARERTAVAETEPHISLLPTLLAHFVSSGCSEALHHPSHTATPPPPRSLRETRPWMLEAPPFDQRRRPATAKMIPGERDTS